MKNKTSEKLLQFLQEGKKQGTAPFDTQGTVQRVEGDTAWVRFPGAEQDTPIRKTINAQPGDNVQVRVGGGDAWLVGNQTAPPTDDRTALEALESASIARNAATNAQLSAAAAGSAALDAQAAAQQATTDAATASAKADAASTAAADAEAKATAAGTAAAAAGTAAAAAQTSADAAGRAASAAQTSADAAGTAAQQAIADAGAAGRAASLAQAAADAAQGDIDEQQEWFWHDALGSHILGDTTGYRNDITSTGMDIIETSSQESVAAFQATGARIGKANGAHSVIDDTGQRFYGKTGTTTLATLGFEEIDGVNTLYFTFGSRKAGSQKGQYSFAAGKDATASANYSHAEGLRTTASGQYTHAEGYETTASTMGAHAEGISTTASLSSDHAEGSFTTASGGSSHAEGLRTTASGQYSHASGWGTTAGSQAQTAIGKFNDNKSANAFEIGNGTSSATSNALEVTWTGDVTASGDITAGGAITATGDITTGGDITATGDITAGTVQDAAGNILADKADMPTNVGDWNGTEIRAKSVPSGTTGTNAINPDNPITLAPGKYLVYLFIQWYANVTGRRYVNLATTAGANVGLHRWLSDSKQATEHGVVTNNIAATLELTAQTDLYINVLQNSGVNLSLYAYYNFVKIG